MLCLSYLFAKQHAVGALHIAGKPVLKLTAEHLGVSRCNGAAAA
jgi:hypothetical protein